MMESECCSPPAAVETVGAKFHASLNVSDLARSVAFYRLLFNLEPTKQRQDYARFELADPPLVLTLMPGRPVAGGILNHFGLRAPDATVLVEIQRRLEVSGIRTKREEGVECCYARQTKFWVADPDRTFWEIYVVHEDLEEYGGDDVPGIEQLAATVGEAQPARIVWQHYIGQPTPAKIPHADDAVQEVVFEGAANLQPANASLDALLSEAFRVLQPGGEARLHGLTCDTPLTEPLPALPGPAAVVEHVPTHAEVVHALLKAGFINVQLEKLSSTAHFTVGNVPLREILICGRKPGHRQNMPEHSAIYLGPLAQVTDDFGNTFRRGELTTLNNHDWLALSESAGEQFLFLPRGTRST